MEKCLNCSQEFSGNYCNYCGQKKHQGNLTMKMVFSDFILNVFLFDSRLYKTLIALIIKPGVTIQEFLAGKRKAYIPPFQLFLLFMTIYLLVFSYLGDNVFDLMKVEGAQSGDSIGKQEMLKGMVKKNMDVLFFIFTPIIAMYISFFYRKINYNFPQTLIFSLYVVGVNFLMSSLILLVTVFLPKLFILKALIIFGYLPFAISQFTNSLSFLGFIKAILTIMVSYITFAITILLFVLIYFLLFIKH